MVGSVAISLWRSAHRTQLPHLLPVSFCISETLGWDVAVAGSGRAGSSASRLPFARPFRRRREPHSVASRGGAARSSLARVRAPCGLSGGGAWGPSVVIDSIQLQPGNQLAQGDPKANGRCPQIGCETLAVADATPMPLQDGLPERRPGGFASVVTTAMDPDAELRSLLNPAPPPIPASTLSSRHRSFPAGRPPGGFYSLVATSE